ncbi:MULTISPECIES: hypothetical protein [unclassified Spirosoma]|uniref:hypothetical protein n=1 Tax=unclassified Spirosoma TaxID=2621999 RepID=UPI000AF1DEC5|nr:MULTISPECIES: hypothetical protein [unclassified Spirosoma]MBN8823464.1 hypothetical protein [Spirosoma sp.]
MKNCRALSFCLLGMWLFVTCHRSEVEPPRFLDGSPRIKSIAFSGISSDNVSIDQATRTIWVIMPAKLPDYIDINMELTDNAEWVNKQSGVKGSGLFGCETCSRIDLIDKTAMSSQATYGYQIKRKASAPLQAGVLTVPLQYNIRNANGMELAIPMLNLYGNRLPKEARFTHDKTGETLQVKRDSALSWIYPDSHRIYFSSYTNQLAIYLYDANLLPGNYHIDLILDDDSILSVPQPVVVTQGTADFEYESEPYMAYRKKDFGYRVAVNDVLTVDGYNLFEGTVAIEWVDNQNNVIKPSGIRFDRYGRRVQIPVPAGLLPGQYSMRVWQNDVKLPYTYCLRVNVTGDTKNRPIIGTIGDDSAPCSLRDPVPVNRGVRVNFSSSLKQQVINGVMQTAVLKLTAIASKDVYYAPVAPYDERRGWDPAESVTIPITVPPGFYTVSLQVIDDKTSVLSESESYGRIIDVK